MQEYGVGIFDSLPTKSSLKKALKKGQITVNGSFATTATFVREGDLIAYNKSVNMPSNSRLIFPLEVLFEDEYLAAINKPAGILVSANTFKSIANALPQNLKTSSLQDATKPQPVHRLDYATTGVVLIGKTSSSILALNQLFENKQIKKTYYAVTIGKMEAEGEIKAPIDSKNATSLFKIVTTVHSKRFEYLNLVKLKPATGRRHQLRIHLASIGNPILGDKDYSPPDLLLKGKGMYLHAQALEFIHPFTQKNIEIATQFPKRFVKLFGEF